MLTKKQYDLLVFIDQRLHANGVSPSFDEMKDALNLRSKSGIHRLITSLEERGFIRRLPHRARALEVLKLPDNLEKSEHQNPFDDKPSYARNIITGNFKNSSPEQRISNNINDDSEVIQLPLYGKIAAGTGVEALRDNSNMIDIPASMLTSGEHFALEVDGESMIDAGILDGDTVLIRRSDTAENGTIVVALIEDNEVTLKRIRRRGNSVALEPANKHFETRIFGPDQIKVQGRLVGLLRQY